MTPVERAGVTCPENVRSLPNPFPVRRYLFTFMVTRPIRSDAVSASTIRGVIGAALRNTVCITGQSTCDGCPAIDSCAYPSVFEARPGASYSRARGNRTANPYIVDVAGDVHITEFCSGESLQFSLTLVGTALRKLDLLVGAARQAFASGVGPSRGGKRGSAELQKVELETLPYDTTTGEGVVVFDPASGRTQGHVMQTEIPCLSHSLEKISLTLQSPLRIERNKRPLSPEELQPVDFLRALVLRQAVLLETQIATDLSPNVPDLLQRSRQVQCDAELHWQDAKRYSGRQGRVLPRGGLVGRLSLKGDLSPFWELLFFGQYLHVGKGATTGNGAYRVQSIG